MIDPTSPIHLVPIYRDLSGSTLSFEALISLARAWYDRHPEESFLNRRG